MAPNVFGAVLPQTFCSHLVHCESFSSHIVKKLQTTGVFHKCPTLAFRQNYWKEGKWGMGDTTVNGNFRGCILRRMGTIGSHKLCRLCSPKIKRKVLSNVTVWPSPAFPALILGTQSSPPSGHTHFSSVRWILGYVGLRRIHPILLPAAQ